MSDAWLDDVRWGSDGLVTAIAQDVETGRILMVAHMNREAASLTASTGVAHYWSRSRGRLWRKGEESGNTQQVSRIDLDCDGDVILMQIIQAGGVACHTGRESCFFRELRDGVWVTRDPVLRDPADIYGAHSKKELS